MLAEAHGVSHAEDEKDPTSKVNEGMESLDVVRDREYISDVVPSEPNIISNPPCIGGDRSRSSTVLLADLVTSSSICFQCSARSSIDMMRWVTGKAFFDRENVVLFGICVIANKAATDAGIELESC